VLQAFLAQYYLRHDLPPTLVISESIEDVTLFTDIFSSRAERRVRIVSRPRGERLKLVELARENAQSALRQHLASHAGMRKRLNALQELLDLDEAPGRMECFDISHTRGEATVASCVVFDADGPRKSDYRRFNISGIEPGDDYAAMYQALSRRYQRLKSGEGVIPDILFIDGGKGQVSQAHAVLEELQIDETLVVGVSKGPDRRPGDENLIVGRERRVLEPGPDSVAGHLIQWIRDEAHRFAITGHRGQRAKARQRSTLEDIPGIGAKRRRTLLSHFGGLQGVRKAGVEELCSIDGISRDLAQRIYDSLRQ
jgi:excinuclease ABC subunit C